MSCDCGLCYDCGARVVAIFGVGDGDARQLGPRTWAEYDREVRVAETRERSGRAFPTTAKRYGIAYYVECGACEDEMAAATRDDAERRAVAHARSCPAVRARSRPA